MKYFTEKFGIKGEATYYLHEPSSEINPNQKYPVMIVVPGGGYVWTSDREAEPIASEFYAKNYHAVIVKYSTEGWEAYDKSILPENPSSVFPQPLVELTKVIANLKSKEEEWHIDTENINLIGFSAGGNLVAQLAVYWKQKWLEELTGFSRESYKPKNIAAAYPVLDFLGIDDEHSDLVYHASLGTINPSEEEKLKISPVHHVDEDTIPMFLWHTTEDPIVSSMNSLKMALELEKSKVPYELHVYQRGIHGISLGDKRTSRKENQINKHAQSWLRILFSWLESSNN